MRYAVGYREVAPEAELDELRKKLADSEKEREKLRLRYFAEEAFLAAFVLITPIALCVGLLRHVWIWSGKCSCPDKGAPMVVIDDPAAIKQR